MTERSRLRRFGRVITGTFRGGLVASALASSVAVSSGCGIAHGVDYARGLAAGDREEVAGRFAEAARAYDAAAKIAKTREDAVHALYLGATMHRRAGETALATERFDAIASLTPSTLDAPSSALAAAEIRLASKDASQSKAAEGAFDFLLAHFPNTGSARVGFHIVLRQRSAELGPKGADAWLASIEPALAATDLGPDIAYARAAAHEADNDIAGARDRYVGVATKWPYPAGDLWDDALWHASLLDEKLGNPRAAIDDLETMLAQHETALLSGSYQRPRYTPAAWRVAELWRDQLHDRVRARDAFHRLYSEMTTSVLRDDALWQEALLWGEEGDTGTACERLETLADDFPDSRYVPCAAERCPRITRASGSKAPRTCRASIERSATEQAARDSSLNK